jgi:hypothetical protein
LIHLQIRANDTDAQWTPPNRYNLTGDRSILRVARLNARASVPP